MDINNLSPHDIDKILIDLKYKQQSFLASVKYFKDTFNISLQDSQEIVINSKVWESEKDQLIKNHEQTELEFFKAMGDDSRG